MDTSRTVIGPPLDGGLSSRYARPALLAGLTCLVVATLVSGRYPPVAAWEAEHWLAALAIVALPVLLTARRRGPLRPWRVALIVTLALAATAMVAWRMTPVAVPSMLGQLAFLTSLIIPRGHPVIGSATGATMLLTLAAWGIWKDLPIPEQLNGLAQPVVGFAICWALRLVSIYLVGSRQQAIGEQVDAAVGTERVRTAAIDERRLMDDIAGLVEPLLERIAAGESLTPELHAEVAAVDEDVRTLMRPDLPRHPELLAAVSKARRRGASVRLVGGGDRIAPVLSDALVSELTDLISEATFTKAVVMFGPASRGETTSVLLEGAGRVDRFEFAADGRPAAGRAPRPSESA